VLREEFVKRVLSRITAAILIAGTLGACAPEADSVQDTGSVRVLTPMQNSQGQYSLDFFELHGLSELQTLTGKFVRFFMSPRIVDGRLNGTSPKARFIRNTDGNYIPANEITQQLVTVYAHMQRLALLDEELGASGVNTWPRDVGVAVRVKGGLNNNAFYDGETDSMLFVPYNQAGLPIAINGGILAHEHFHSLFFKLSMPDSPFKGSLHEDGELLSRQRRQVPIVVGGEDMDATSLRAYYTLVMTRGLNEGLADFWGWMYTGDPDFIAQSLPKEGATRSLKVADEMAVNSLPSPESIERSLNVFHNTGSSSKMKDYAVGYSYSLATQFSRVLKRFTDVYAKAHDVESLQARKDVAKLIVKTLPKIKEAIESSGDEPFSSAQFIILLSEQLPSLKKEECGYLVEVLNNSGDLSSFKYVCAGEVDQRIAKQEISLQAKTDAAATESGKK
jgi:hypothetical protein